MSATPDAPSAWTVAEIAFELRVVAACIRGTGASTWDAEHCDRAASALEALQSRIERLDGCEKALELTTEELERGVRMIGSAPPQITAALAAARAALKKAGA